MLLQTEIASKDISQECLPGAGAEFTRGAEELSRNASVLKSKPFGKGIHAFSAVFLGAVGRGQGWL